MDFAADPAVTAIVPPHRFIVLTAYPSVATAVAVIRQGMGDYLPRPASSEALHAALIGDEPEVVLAAPTKWPSLDRTIWEYINQVWMSAGSLSEAARRLRVDRRSLRRMLAKHPPPQ